MRPVTPDDLSLAMQIAQIDPIANCFLISKLIDFNPKDTQILLVSDRDKNLGLAYVGINTTTANCSYEMLTHLTDYLMQAPIATSSIVGKREDVFGLWQQVSSFLGPARLIRSDQPLLFLDKSPLIAPNTQVRLATIDELEKVLPVAAMMFREEVGIDPLRPATRAVYQSRVLELLQNQRTFVLTDENEIIFKVDIGVQSDTVIQIQGVWVAPSHRGQRISAPALAAAVVQMRKRVPTVSLYVNDFNYRALRLYRSLGFEQVGTFASVML